MIKRTIAFLLFALFINFSFAFGMTPAEEKKLFQNIAEIKATLKVFMEQTDKRFEQVNKRFDQIMNFLWILTAIFTTLTATVIGFAYWDRRTIIYSQGKG